jgi:hypothetical protein
MFPKIELQCPFKERLAEAMDGDLCRICSHKVHDLDAMERSKRRAFLNAPGDGQVCVRYRLPAALAAAALAAGLVASPAAAQESGTTRQTAPAPAQEAEEDAGEIVGVFSRRPQLQPEVVVTPTPKQLRALVRKQEREERRRARRQRWGS